MTAEESFIISIGIRPTSTQGVERTIKQLETLDTWCKQTGKSAEETERIIDTLLSNVNFRGKFIDSSGTLTDLGKAVKKRYTEESQRKSDEETYRADRRNKQEVSRLAGIANPFAFISPKSGVQIQNFLNNAARVVPALKGFSVAFQAVKGVWDFSSAIAELNTRILQLGYTSTLGAQKITDLGAAVTAFGGSSEKVAQGNERFVLQIEKLKRGGGLGYLGDVAYKYGFSVDMTASWEKNNKAAIDFARTLDKQARMAFLKEWDPANFVSNMMKASMPKGKVEENEAFYKSYEDLGDAEQVADATQRFNEETAKAKRAWTAIINQMASTLLPIMTKLVAFVAKIGDYIAKSPNLIKMITGLLVGLTSVVAGLILKETVLATVRIAGACASGNWAGAAIAAGILGLGIAGAVALSSESRGANKKDIESVDEDAVLVKDIASGKAVLTARERYLIDEQEKKAFGKPLGNDEWNFQDLYDSSAGLSSVFKRVERAALELRDSFAKTTEASMSVQEAQNLATLLSNVNNVSNVANSSTANINVNVSQNFNEADTSEIRAGIYDVGSEISAQIAQAAKRYNT